MGTVEWQRDSSCHAAEGHVSHCQNPTVFKGCQQAQFLMCNLVIVTTQHGPGTTHLGPPTVSLQSLDQKLLCWRGFLNEELSNCLLFLSLLGLLESSTRLKPHEAQNYRKKALWVSWFSIIVTLALAVAAFSECLSWSLAGRRVPLLPVFLPDSCGMCLGFQLTVIDEYIFGNGWVVRVLIN